MTGMPASPFFLDRLAAPLLVRRGTVSLFAAGSADEGPEALPRVFLCELSAGALLAPVPASPDGRRVVAVGWEDANCEPVQPAALSAPDCPDELAAALDRWIVALTGALARLIVVHPKPDYTLAARQSRRRRAAQGWLLPAMSSGSNCRPVVASTAILRLWVRMRARRCFRWPMAPG